mmetsp:Transcript_34715/g.53254  ORF Transcript_34715/g.53254 Transcript_34715/m.53254 type:complete len:211 (-) Transcript_34715:247-879(-)
MQMVLDEKIILEFVLVVTECFLKLFERALGCSTRNRRHCIDVFPGILYTLSSGYHPGNIHVGLVGFDSRGSLGAHAECLDETVENTTEHHVLEARNRGHPIVHLIQLLKGFQKIGMRRVVIPLFAVEHPAHAVDAGLEGWRNINGVGTGSARRERGLCFGKAAQSKVNLALQEVRFDQELLVVQALEFQQEPIYEFQCGSEIVLLKQHGC